MIEGELVQLRPATLQDRRMLYEWGHSSDIVSLIHLSDTPESFEDWCKEWKELIFALCNYMNAQFGVQTFMMQSSERNPRAIRAYEKAGFIRTPATPEEILAEWDGVDHHDSVLMIRQVMK